MEENSDNSLVPSLSVVVENIYSSCDLEKKDRVPASDLIEFVRPLLLNDPIVIDELQKFLDPNDENPFISRNSFHEIMRKWTSKINTNSEADLNEISFKEDSSSEKCYSSNRPSLGLEEVSHLLNFSGFSPKSCSSVARTSTSNKTKLLEDKIKELEHKYTNAMSELSLVKSQLAATEEQYAELKLDFERTNRRLTLEQQVNEDLQKSMEQRDNVNEEMVHTQKEIENLHRMLSSSKKENISLRDYIEILETEKEDCQKQFRESSRKEQHLKEELAKLQSALSSREDEIRLFQKNNDELLEKMNEQASLIEHITQVSDMLREDNSTLKTVVKKKGLSELKNLPLKSPDVSFLGTPFSRKNSKSPIPNVDITSATPFRNMYRPMFFEREIFHNLDFLQKISKSFSPNPLETSQNYITTRKHLVVPKNLKTTFENCGATHNSLKIPSSDGSSSNSFSSQNQNSDTPNSSSTNPASDVMDDMDLSNAAEYSMPPSDGQDLLSELKACKYLENREEFSTQEGRDDWLRIVKEHENCSKLIKEYQEQILDYANNITEVEKEHKNLIEKFENMAKDAKFLEITLCENKTQNELLKKENLDLNKANKELLNRIKVLEDKEIEYEELYEHSKCEKETLEETLKTIRKEKNALIEEIECLQMKNDSLTVTRESELGELHTLQVKNSELENEQEKYAREVEQLSIKLEQCTKMGRNFVDNVKKKIKDQTRKIDFLKDSNDKFEELVQELKIETEMNETKLSSLELMKNEAKKRENNDRNDSTSTEGSETNLQCVQSKYKCKSYGRKSTYEKQQFLFNRMEEKLDASETQLRIANQKISHLEFQLYEMDQEKNKLIEENESILKELDAMKLDVSLKIHMVEQLKESHTFEIKQLRESLEKEKNVNCMALSEAEKRDEILKKQIKVLEKHLDEIVQEKENAFSLLHKQGNKIVSLKKALTQLSETPDESKNFEHLIVEKESMLNFSRELLVKSNTSLEETERKLILLESQLEECRAILTKTADDLFSSAISAFQAWKDSFESDNLEWIEEMESACTENTFMSDFTVQNIWKLHERLNLTSKLLKALAKKYDEFASHKKGSSKISKFTLKPSKLDVIHFTNFEILDGSVGDVKDSGVKECTSNNENKNDLENQNSRYDKNVSEHQNSPNENETITNWLENGSKNLRKALGDRKMTEKKFAVLALTWKSTYENSRKRYTNAKHHCSKLRDSYLHTLLQLVTYIRNHKCLHEQKSLIEALTLIDKLKDIIFDIFKLASRYGASKQELHSMKCWNLIVDYVNGLHIENEKLKLLSSTSPKTVIDSSNDALRLRNVSVGLASEMDNYSTAVEASSNEDLSPKKQNMRCMSKFLMIFIFFCVLLTFLMVIQMECVRNNGDVRVCPLDFVISKKTSPLM